MLGGLSAREQDLQLSLPRQRLRPGWQQSLRSFAPAIGCAGNPGRGGPGPGEVRTLRVRHAGSAQSVTMLDRAKQLLSEVAPRGAFKSLVRTFLDERIPG